MKGKLLRLLENQEVQQINTLKMKLYLKKEQFELLNKYCEIDTNSYELQEDNNKILLIGNKQYFENLLDEISDILIEIGMDSNDEPNKLGLQMEEIIDVLSEVVYD